MVREEPVFFRGTRVGDARGVFGRNFGRALVEVEAPAALRVAVEFVGPQGDPGLGGLVLAEGRLRVPQDPREARRVAGFGPGALADRAVADLLDEAREPVLGLAAVREADPSEVLDSLADERVDGRRDERLLPLELVGLARRIPAGALGGDAVLKGLPLDGDGRAELVELLDRGAELLERLPRDRWDRRVRRHLAVLLLLQNLAEVALELLGLLVDAALRPRDLQVRPAQADGADLDLPLQELDLAPLAVDLRERVGDRLGGHAPLVALLPVLERVDVLGLELAKPGRARRLALLLPVRVVLGADLGLVLQDRVVVPARPLDERDLHVLRQFVEHAELPARRR